MPQRCRSKATSRASTTSSRPTSSSSAAPSRPQALRPLWWCTEPRRAPARRGSKCIAQHELAEARAVALSGNLEEARLGVQRRLVRVAPLDPVEQVVELHPE